jgi:WD40 repeat protein
MISKTFLIGIIFMSININAFSQQQRVLDYVESTAISLDQTLLTQYGQKKLVVWNLENGLISSEKVLDFSVESIHFGPENNVLWVVDEKHRFLIYDLQTGEVKINEALGFRIDDLYTDRFKTNLFVSTKNNELIELETVNFSVVHALNLNSLVKNENVSYLNFFDPDLRLFSIVDSLNDQTFFTFPEGKELIKQPYSFNELNRPSAISQDRKGMFLLDTNCLLNYYSWNNLELPQRSWQLDTLTYDFELNDSLIIAKTDKGIFLYNLSTGAKIENVPFKPEISGELILLNNGKALYSMINGTSIEYFDIYTGKRISLINDLVDFQFESLKKSTEPARLVLPVGHNSNQINSKASPDEQVIATWENSLFKIWDLETGTELISHELPNSTIKFVEFSGDSKFCVLSTDENKGLVLEIESGSFISEIRSPAIKGTPHYYISAEASILYAKFSNNKFYVWSLPEGKLIFEKESDYYNSWNQKSSIKDIDVFSLDGEIVVWRKGIRLNTKGSVAKVIENPTNDLLALVSKDKNLIIFESIENKEHAICKGHENNVTDAFWSRDGKSLYTWSKYDQTIRRFNSEGVQLFTTLKHNRNLVYVAFSPDEKLLASICRDSILRIWDAENGKLVKRISVRGKSCPKGEDDCPEVMAYFKKTENSLLVEKEGDLIEYSIPAFEKINEYPNSYYDPQQGVILSIDDKGEKQSGTEGYSVKIDPDRARARLIRLSDSVVMREINFLGFDQSIEFIRLNEQKDAIEAYSEDSKFELSLNDRMSPVSSEQIDRSKLDLDIPLQDRFKSLPKQKYSLHFPVNGEQVLIEEESDEDYFPNRKVLIKRIADTSISDSIQCQFATLTYDEKYIVLVKESKAELSNNTIVEFHELNKKGLIDQKVAFQISLNGVVSEIIALRGDSLLVETYQNYQSTLHLISVDKKQVKKEELNFYGEKLYYLSEDGFSLLNLTVPNSLNKVRKELNGNDLIEFNPERRTILYFNDSTENMVLVDLDKGTIDEKIYPKLEGFPISIIDVIDRKKEHNGLLLSNYSIAFDAEKKRFKGHEDYFTTYFEDSLILWDLKTLKRLITLKFEIPYFSLPSSVYDSKKQLFYITENKAIACYDVRTKEKLFERLQLQGDNYLIIDKNYRYDGTPEARKMLYFVCGTEIIDLDQIKDSLYIPNLAQRLINREDIDYLPKLKDLKLCGFNPKVKAMDTEDQGYMFSIDPGEGGLASAEIYINGVLRQTVKSSEMLQDQRGLFVSVSDSLISKFSVAGEKLNVTVQAKNAVSGISSRDVSTTLKPRIQSSVGRAAHFYGIFIGINDYKGESIDLKYAAQDANELKKLMENSAKKLFNTADSNRIHTYILTADKAGSQGKYPDRKNILETFKEIENLSHPEDVLMIFFGGHGDVNKDNNLILLSAEASKDDIVGISMKEINESLTRIPANKRILILDACYSGQAINELGISEKFISHRDYSSFEKESQRVKQLDAVTVKSGLSVLSSSGSDQKSLEIPEYQHGLLTFGLLSTALMKDDDQYLELESWLKESEDFVLKLERDQIPQRFTPVNYPIGIIDSSLKNSIELKEIPTLTISNVFSENGFDELKMRKELVRFFQRESSKTSNEDKVLFSESENDKSFNINLRYEENKGQLKFIVTLDRNSLRIGDSFTINGTLTDLDLLMYDLFDAIIVHLSTIKMSMY